MSVRAYDVGAVISELRDEMLAANEVRERRARTSMRAPYLLTLRAPCPHTASHT